MFFQTLCTSSSDTDNSIVCWQWLAQRITLPSSWIYVYSSKFCLLISSKLEAVEIILHWMLEYSEKKPEQQQQPLLLQVIDTSVSACSSDIHRKYTINSLFLIVFTLGSFVTHKLWILFSCSLLQFFCESKRAASWFLSLIYSQSSTEHI